LSAAGVSGSLSGYRPDLDGLRAVAILLVIAGHASWPFANDAGTVGVTVFFVLSGYLITGLLVNERQRTGRIDLPAFYRRRARRLLPALVAVMTGVSLIALTGAWQPAPLLTGIVAASFYVTNWFSQTVDAGPMSHTWTLAIEGQFYLLWPIAMILFPRYADRICVAGIAVAVVARMILDPFTAYFATVTRMDALLLGCLLALLAIRTPSVASVVGLTTIAVTAILAGRISDQLVLPLAIAGAAVVCTSCWSGLGVLSPVGRRAYGLYLWNLPMVLLFPPFPAVVATFASAELSYRLVERRWLRPRSAVPVGRAETDVPRQIVEHRPNPNPQRSAP
jgi:peptidoglycan/LPS O-acetylase OafA/YrhL